MKALILAGGYATRLWPLTEKRAKPLLILNGKTILAHILEKIPTNIDTYLLTNKKFEQDFTDELKKIERPSVKIFCEDSFSDGEKLGALGAISMFLHEEKINDDLLIFAGDNLLPELNVEHIFCSNNESRIAIREVDTLHEARNFGVVELKKESEFQNNNLRVQRFEEKPEHPRSKLVMTGFLSIGKNLISILHDFAKKSPDALGGIFIEFLRLEKTVIAEKVSGSWFDIGSFETYLEAHRVLQKEFLKVEKNVKNQSNKFSGKVFIGKNSKIKNCKILDSIIYPNCELENCHISGSVIDEGCKLRSLDLNRKLIRKNTSLNG